MNLQAADVARHYGGGSPRSMKPDAKGRYRTNCPRHGGDGQNLLVWNKEGNGHLMVKCATVGCETVLVMEQIHDELGKRQSVEIYKSPPKEKAPVGAEASANVIGVPTRTTLTTSQPEDVVSIFKQSLKKNPTSPRTNDPVNGPWFYPDAAGNPLLKITRINKPEGEKDYPQAHWDDGKWIYKKLPGPQPFYNLPELVVSYREIVITEGEKSCEAAMVRFPDYDCTTWPGGSGVPLDADWSLIAGRRVILWPDADEPGIKCMGKLAAHLRTLNCTVRVVDISKLPQDGYDVADPEPDGVNYRMMLDAAQVVEIAPAKVVDLLPPMEDWSHIRNIEFPPEKWAVDGLLPCSLAGLYGAGKIGKSYLCLDLIWSVTTGSKFLGRTTHKGTVLYMDYEGKAKTLQKRLIRDLDHIGEDADGRLKYMKMTAAHNLVDEPIFEALKKRVKDTGDVRLIVIDTMERAVKIRSRGNAYQQDVDRLAAIQEWASTEEICILFVHHTTKHRAEGGESYDGASGSRGITGTIETNLSLDRKGGGGDVFNLRVQSRDMADMDIPVAKEGCRWRQLDDVEVAENEANRMTPQQKLVWALVEKVPWLGPTKIANMTGVKRGTVAPMLLSWVDAGKMQTKPDGRSTLYALKGEPNHVQQQLTEAF